MDAGGPVWLLGSWAAGPFLNGYDIEDETAALVDEVVAAFGKPL